MWDANLFMSWKELNEFNLVEDPLYRIIYGVALIVISIYVFFTSASILWKISSIIFVLVAIDVMWTAYREGST